MSVCFSLSLSFLFYSLLFLSTPSLLFHLLSLLLPVLFYYTLIPYPLLDSPIHHLPFHPCLLSLSTFIPPNFFLIMFFSNYCCSLYISLSPRHHLPSLSILFTILPTYQKFSFLPSLSFSFPPSLPPSFSFPTPFFPFFLPLLLLPTSFFAVLPPSLTYHHSLSSLVLFTILFPSSSCPSSTPSLTPLILFSPR